jgi:hypothetical protein
VPLASGRGLLAALAAPSARCRNGSQQGIALQGAVWTGGAGWVRLALQRLAGAAASGRPVPRLEVPPQHPPDLRSRQGVPYGHAPAGGGWPGALPRPACEGALRQNTPVPAPPPPPKSLAHPQRPRLPHPTTPQALGLHDRGEHLLGQLRLAFQRARGGMPPCRRPCRSRGVGPHAVARLPAGAREPGRGGEAAQRHRARPHWRQASGGGYRRGLPPAVPHDAALRPGSGGRLSEWYRGDRGGLPVLGARPHGAPWGAVDAPRSRSGAASAGAVDDWGFRAVLGVSSAPRVRTQSCVTSRHGLPTGPHAAF